MTHKRSGPRGRGSRKRGRKKRVASPQDGQLCVDADTGKRKRWSEELKQWVET